MNWEVLTMKSRTLSSETAFLKKNILRFLPFWGLYILCLLLGLMIISSGDKEFYVAIDMGECARIMGLVNCGYGLLVAELLFGDLFDSRMCSGIHCLPLRREQIFGMNLLSGLLFSLVPTLIMALASLPLMMNSLVVDAWLLSFLWLLAANLQFVFFFGLAVFCVFLTGNRFSLAIAYGILNLWSVLLMMVMDSIYVPMLRGVSINSQWWLTLSPVAHMIETPLVIVSRLKPDLPGTFEIQPTWGSLWLCAGIGLVLMGLGLLLYRRRKLECAGEFIAVRAAKPVFLVIFSLTAASIFAVISQEFFGAQDQMVYGMIFNAVGLLVGWFVGSMLMEKNVKVFHKRNVIGSLILLALVLGSFLLTWVDILGIRSWVPDPEDVAYVRVFPNYSYYYDDNGDYGQPGEIPGDAITDPGDIQLAAKLHALALEQNITEEVQDAYYESLETAEGEYRRPDRRMAGLSLEYTMKNGSVKRRCYFIWSDGETGRLDRWLLSQPQSVFGASSRMLTEAEGLEDGWVHSVSIPEAFLTGEDLAQLKQALLQDCEEGHMAQNWDLHEEPLFEQEGYVISSTYLRLMDSRGMLTVDIYSDAVHTVRWLEDHGILQQLREGWKEDAENRAKFG